MSHRTNIVMIMEDGIVHAVYCHDGHEPSGGERNMGAILARHYNSKERVFAIMCLGDLSTLGRELTFRQHEDYAYLTAHPDHTLAYHRDRGDDWGEAGPETFGSWEDYHVFSDAEIIYVYDCAKGSWSYGVAPNYRCGWRAKEGLKPLPAECYAAQDKKE